jgi:transcriptional regulator GlxA family with amidase domain
MMSLAGTTEVMRAANEASERQLYEWHYFSPDGRRVLASNGVRMDIEGHCDAAADFKTVIVCGGHYSHAYDDRELSLALRKADRNGADIGGLDTGAHALARANLLDGYRATIHWDNMAAFAENYPSIQVTPGLYQVDRNRFTCGGGTAAIDLMLHLVTLKHGAQLATTVSEQLLIERIRSFDDMQRRGAATLRGVRHPKLMRVIEMMEQNLETPLQRSHMAGVVELSPRQLERLFNKYMGCTPAKYYIELRLRRARLLLLQTGMSIIDVALACGFVSASHFSKCYKDFFGHTPRRERDMAPLVWTNTDAQLKPFTTAQGVTVGRLSQVRE